MLSDLIKCLESLDPDSVVPIGFGEPMSYRGYYEDLAFKPAVNARIGDMLTHARSALGATFQGYKGGDFTMEDYTDCWIAEYGETSEDRIGKVIMALWALTAFIPDDAPDVASVGGVSDG